MADEKCIALVDFTPMRPDELAFSKGDVITVLAKGKDSGFWEGRIGERRGLFPNCFVSSNMHPSRPPTFVDMALALFNYSPQAASELPFQKHDLISIRGAGSSPGWYYGINESVLQRLRDADPTSPEPAPLLFPSNYVTCNLVRAQYAFSGRQHCELTINPGDVILVHRRWNDGWWEGSAAAWMPVKGSTSSGLEDAMAIARSGGPGGFIVGGMRRGIFPSNYTVSNVPQVDPPLFCRRCRTVFAPKIAKCKECERNEEIVRTMLTTLDDHTRGLLDASASRIGESPTIDLFAHVDLHPSAGKGALLLASDVSRDATTVRPRLAV
jgi:hypothetical protein